MTVAQHKRYLAPEENMLYLCCGLLFRHCMKHGMGFFVSLAPGRGMCFLHGGTWVSWMELVVAAAAASASAWV
jgi:hypothetical protein